MTAADGSGSGRCYVCGVEAPQHDLESCRAEYDDGCGAMTHTCDFRLPGCFEDADYVAALGAGGDRFACGPCMNASDEPDAFIPLADVDLDFPTLRNEPPYVRRLALAQNGEPPEITK